MAELWSGVTQSVTVSSEPTGVRATLEPKIRSDCGCVATKEARRQGHSKESEIGVGVEDGVEAMGVTVGSRMLEAESGSAKERKRREAQSETVALAPWHCTHQIVIVGCQNRANRHQLASAARAQHDDGFDLLHGLVFILRRQDSDISAWTKTHSHLKPRSGSQEIWFLRHSTKHWIPNDHRSLLARSRRDPQPQNSKCEGWWLPGLRHGPTLPHVSALMQQHIRRFVRLQLPLDASAPMHRFAATSHQQTRGSRVWVKRLPTNTPF